MVFGGGATMRRWQPPFFKLGANAEFERTLVMALIIAYAGLEVAMVAGNDACPMDAVYLHLLLSAPHQTHRSAAELSNHQPELAAGASLGQIALGPAFGNYLAILFIDL